MNETKTTFSKPFIYVCALFVLFRIYIISHIGLIDDEAYHWSWTRNLNYSYFDHPGMVAWVIWPFVKVFGQTEWAIRLPGFLMFCSIFCVVYRLGKDLFDHRVAELASALLFIIPLWGVASLGTLPDIPLGLFWIILAWIFWQSVRTDENVWSVQKTWVWIGIVMGLGMNSKLTCCLIGLGMGAYLLITPRLRWHLRTPWPYVGALITFILMIPVFVWNAQHQWASFDYQFLARHQEAHHLDIGRWLQFWSYQWIFMSPVVYFLMVVAFFYGIRNVKDDRWRFIFALPAPALALFYYQPLMSAYKPHWSGPAYMILLFGAVKIYLDGIPGFIHARSRVITVFSLLFMIPFQLLYIPLLTPVIPKIFAAYASPDQKWNPTWDFTNEFYGWRELGQHVKEMRDEIAAKTGKPPELAAQRYELIAQLTWGTQEKVWQLCRDRDQYLYEQSDADRAALLGKDFLVVNNDKYQQDPREVANFDSCDKTDWPYYRGKTLARTFFIYYCHNFQGLK
jgi:hypothetical protein